MGKTATKKSTMTSKRPKPAASAWTLMRRAAALEKANKGRPTARSKALRAEAARLRRLIRQRAKNIVTLLGIAQQLPPTNDAGWKVTETPQHSEDRAATMTYTEAALGEMKREQREAMETNIVRGVVGRYRMIRVGPYEPFVLSGEEAHALMNVLDRAGY